MRRPSDRLLVPELIFCALPLAYYLLRLPSMPETVPVHWNAAGEVTRYAPRFCFEMLLLGCLGYFGLLLGMAVRSSALGLTKDEKNMDHAVVDRLMRWVQALMCLLFTGMALYDISKLCLGQEPGQGFAWKLGMAVIALSLIVTGDQLPKLQRNRYSGARTAYSMSGDEAWHKTQRYAGRVMMAAGAGLLVITLLPVVSAEGSVLAAAAALAAVLILTLSYKGGKKQ